MSTNTSLLISIANYENREERAKIDNSRRISGNLQFRKGGRTPRCGRIAYISCLRRFSKSLVRNLWGMRGMTWFATRLTYVDLIKVPHLRVLLRFCANVI